MGFLNQGCDIVAFSTRRFLPWKVEHKLASIADYRMD
jgi:hypothetical protein